MKKLLVASGRPATWAVAAGLLLALATWPQARAQNPQGPAQSDHALLSPSDTAVYCGVAMVGNQGEPYTLHVGATNPGGAAATLFIRFGDGDAIGFEVPAHTSFSTTQELGGVPDVDNVVKIEMAGGAAMASVRVRAGARDPFANDGEQDNFCLTKNNSDPDPGDVPF